MEPPERDIMRRPPRPPREPVITLQRGLLILFHGFLMAAVAAVAFALASRSGGPEHARAVAFTTMAFTQLFYSFGCRSQTRTLPELGPFTNPYLFGAIAISGLLQIGVVTLPFVRPVFDLTTNPLREWRLIFPLALAPVTVIEVPKLVRAAWARKTQPDVSPPGGSTPGSAAAA